jgi:hypothetical protein
MNTIPIGLCLYRSRCFHSRVEFRIYAMDERCGTSCPVVNVLWWSDTDNKGLVRETVNWNACRPFPALRDEWLVKNKTAAPGASTMDLLSIRLSIPLRLFLPPASCWGWRRLSSTSLLLFPRDTAYLEPATFAGLRIREALTDVEPGSKINSDTFLVISWRPHVPFSLLKSQQQIKVPDKVFFSSSVLSYTIPLETQTLQQPLPFRSI